MKHTLVKWLSAMLIVCMLVTAGPAALMEGEVVVPDVETPSEEVDNSPGADDASVKEENDDNFFEDEVVSEPSEEEQEIISFDLGDIEMGNDSSDMETEGEVEFLLPITEDTDAQITMDGEGEPIAKGVYTTVEVIDNVVYYMYAKFHPAIPFSFTDQPYADANKVGSLNIWNSFKVKAFVENKYHNLWAVTEDNKYIYAGMKKENGKWVQDGTQFLNYDECLTKWTYAGNLQNAELTAGKPFQISGGIFATNTPTYIYSVYCKIEKYDGKTWNQDYNAIGIHEIFPTDKEHLELLLDKTTINEKMHLEKLPVGQYRLVFEVNYLYYFEVPTARQLTADGVYGYYEGETHQYNVYQPFTVVEKIAVDNNDYEAPNYTSSITFNNIAYPTNYKISTSGYALGAGTVNSTYPLTSLKSEIVRDNGQVISSYTRSISGTSYAVKNLDTYSSSDNGVHFSWIKEPGTYYWKLTATDNKGHSETHSMKFTAYKDNPPPADTTKPSISNVKVTNVTSDGYTVSCTVSDNVGVTRVAFPTWTDPSGQDDLKWMDGSISGSTATFNVRVSDHGNQRGCTYITHVYAYDAAGNSNSVSAGNISVPAATVLPTGVSLNTGSLSLTVGQTSTLTSTISPSNATNKSVSWKSSDSSVASVNSNGLVSALKAGTATITATTTNGKTASCTVSVQAAAQVNPTGITLNVSSGTLAVGQTGQLIATVAPANATNKTVTWTSSKTSVAKVDANGKVTAVKKGSAKITAMTSNGKKVTCSIKVVEAPKPKSVALNQKGTVELSLDSTLQLQAAVSPAGVTTTLKWSSSSTKIATVTSDGLVKPVKEGTAKITVKTANGKNATVKIKVFDPYAPQSIAFPVKKGKMKVGTTYTLEYTLKPSTARTTVTLKSSNTKVVSIEGTNTLRALKKGSATITATTSNGKKATVKVTVEK